MEPSPSNPDQSPEPVSKPPPSTSLEETPTLPPRPPATVAELASLLNAGRVEEFNERRPSGLIVFDGEVFSRALMDGANLDRVRFESCKFRQCSMTNASLKGAVFEGCSLYRSYLNGVKAPGLMMFRCVMSDVQFGSSWLDHSKFRLNDMQRCVFDQASLEGAVLNCCLLESCDFDKTRARYVRFEQTRLAGTRFRESDLAKASFSQTHGERVMFDGANLCDAAFNGSWWQDQFSVVGAYIKPGTFHESMFQKRTWDDGQLFKHAKSYTDLPKGVFEALKPEAQVVKPLVDGVPGTDRELFDKAMLALSNMVGLEDVKREVQQLVALLRVARHRELNGERVDLGTMHYVFTGPPGTGKTTVARIFGEVLKSLGYLSKGHFVETDRSGLCGRYLGETGPKTKAVVEEAAGGVLFIDEAYTLASSGAKDQYGEEAIATLLKLMEDRRHDLVVIVAGYGKEMESFIRSNPGLQSRFAHSLHFKGLSDPALTEVVRNSISMAGLVTDENTMRGVAALIGVLRQRAGEGFGNARSVRNIYEKMLRRQAVRITEKGGSLDDKRLTFDDIPCFELAGLSGADLLTLIKEEPVKAFEQGLDAIFRARLGSPR